MGPTARASNIDYDARRDDPYFAYDEVPWNVVTDTSGDVFGRTRVRIGEMRESLNIVRFCLENLPEGPISISLQRTLRQEKFSHGMKPRGERLIHFIRTNGTDKVDRIDIRTPTLANWTSVAVGLVNQNLADIPVIVAAVDPCLSCTSRITVVNTRNKPIGTISLDDLRQRNQERWKEMPGHD